MAGRIDENAVQLNGKKAPRLGHTKSKAGCRRCKLRRVKCNEARPVCSGCQRHEVACEYDDRQHAQLTTIDQTPASQSNTYSTIDSIHGPVQIEPVEQEKHRAQRLLELRLMHHFVSSTAQTMPGAEDAAVFECWTTHIPEISFTHDPLLHALLAVSALHLLTTHPDDTESTAAWRQYFVLALHDHNQSLPTLAAKTADKICLTCLVISVLAFAARRMEVAQPYSVPTETLMIGCGTGEVFHTAFPWIRNDPTSKAATIVKASPQFKEVHSGSVGYDFENKRVRHPPENVDMFAYLMPPEKEVAESDGLWTSETESVYERTLGYLGAIQKAIMAQEPRSIVLRRLMAFSAQMPRPFLDAVRESHPRALVVLAHFFAMTKAAEGVWFMSGIAKGEVLGILGMLPLEWKEQMDWPLQIVGKGSKNGSQQN